MTEIQEKIIEAAIRQFADKGLRFTMDDVAKELRMSKKTLYSVYPTKEDLFLSVADYCFADIKRSEQAVAEDDSLNIVEKIRRILSVMPDKYQQIGLVRLYELKDRHPRVYERVEEYLDTDWDTTIRLLEQGMDEGKIRRVSIPIIKAMFENTIETFFTTDILLREKMSYEEGLDRLVDLILRGIITEHDE